MKVLAIVGSLRRDSWNRKLLRLAAEVLEKKGVRVEEADLGQLPMYNWDLEADGYPEAAIAFRQAFQRSDAVIIAAPEFNHSMPAVLKNAIEWASRPPNVLNDKVIFAMGTTPGRSGSIRMHDHLSASLQSEGCWVIPRPLVLLPEVRNILGTDGQLLDASVGELLEEAMSKLVETVRRLEPRN